MLVYVCVCVLETNEIYLPGKTVYPPPAANSQQVKPMNANPSLIVRMYSQLIEIIILQRSACIRPECARPQHLKAGLLEPGKRRGLL